MRAIIILCMVVSALVGMKSVQDAFSLPRLSEIRDEAVLDSQDQEVAKVLVEAQLRALESMGQGRAFLLGALSIAASLCFVASGRLLRPGGVPRENMRKLAAGSALVAAILRTIDGAQEAVVAGRTGRAAAKALLAKEPILEPSLLEGLPGLLMIVTVVTTCIFAGAFAFFSQYLRSERAKTLLVGL
jgi:hypothetical protein